MMRLIMLFFFLLVPFFSNGQVYVRKYFPPKVRSLSRIPISLMVNDYDLREEFGEKELFVNDSRQFQYIDSCLFSGDLSVFLHIYAFSDIMSYYSYGAIKGNVINGKKEGLWIESTSLKVPGYIDVKQLNYINGVLNGDYVVFNTRGDTLATSTFENGTGLYLDYYYDTGVLKEKGKLVNGKKEGRWYLYDEQSNIIESNIYKNDFCVTQ